VRRIIYISLTVMRTSWTFVLPLGAGAIVAAISFSVWKWRSTKSHIVELEAALAIALKQRAAERTGRIRAQRVHSLIFPLPNQPEKP
jgi:hypothetical protein